MQTVALHTVLRAGHEADYAAVHRTIPDEVARALREHGVQDWRIWVDGRDVFHLVEVEDHQRMRAALRHLPANVEWQATVAPYFEVPDDYGGDDPVVTLLWSLADQLRK
ncbi:L-rhamnose mutarotase [Nocardioides sp. SYSU D00038]|uniref:L-rhamnose mutarotase n=1 Tax=Nocardioides sp. SYSU D00038 TaxID=2812554 RepID=UPI00196761E4|nr:L-rhamnose mutarotase [Nocardioides sp. SYSU D00038]